MQFILQSIQGLPKGVGFQLEDFKWFTHLDKSYRIALGRIFSRRIKNGDFSNVVFVGKDIKNHSIYRVV